MRGFGGQVSKIIRRSGSIGVSQSQWIGAGPEDAAGTATEPAAKEAGLGNVSWHLLRHSNATLHDSIGTPLGTVQALLGHSSSDITRLVYLHSLAEDKRVAVEKLEALIIGPKSDPSFDFGQLSLPKFVASERGCWSGR